MDLVASKESELSGITLSIGLFRIEGLKWFTMGGQVDRDWRSTLTRSEARLSRG